MAAGPFPGRDPTAFPPRLSASRFDAMSRSLARNWWALAVRAVIAILFGVAALALPVATLQVLVLLVAAYVIADGLLAVTAGIRAASRHERWGLLIVEGLIGLAAGAAILLLPGVTVLVFITLLSVWGVVSGALAIFAALRLHNSHGRAWMLVAGIVSVAWGGALFVAPVAGAVILTWWLGGYALVFGFVLLMLALRLRSQRLV